MVVLRPDWSISRFNLVILLFSVHAGHQPHQRGGSRQRQRQLRPGHGHVGGRPRKGDVVFPSFGSTLAGGAALLLSTGDAEHLLVHRRGNKKRAWSRSIAHVVGASHRLALGIINYCWPTCMIMREPLTFARVRMCSVGSFRGFFLVTAPHPSLWVEKMSLKTAA